MNELTPSRQPGRGLIPQPGIGAHTYDVTTQPGRRDLHRARTGSDFQLQDLAGQSIKVQHVVLHWVEDDREDAEPGSLRMRAVLIQPDGTRISTGSASAYKCLADAAEISGQTGPFDPPLSFTVIAVKRGREPGSYLLLEWEG